MKYCQKHNQEYYDFLNDCPICIGETMKPHGYSGYKKTHLEKVKKINRNLKENYRALNYESGIEIKICIK